MVRRREIGLLRAIGARRADIRALLLLEAGFVGLLSGTIGLIAARVAAVVADAVAAGRVPDFPFKPETFFTFSPWLMAAMLVLAIGACLVGALPPAIRAAAGDPSEALAGR